jgi:hypothetical protein
MLILGHHNLKAFKTIWRSSAMGLAKSRLPTMLSTGFQS